MSRMLLFGPMAMTNATASRGSGAANLLTPDPKEVWVDAATGSETYLTFCFSSVRTVDTFLLGFVNAAPGSIWEGGYGVGGITTPLFPPRAMPALSRIEPVRRHAFATFAPVQLDILQVGLTQPAGAPPLQVGIAAAGIAFRPVYNREWGGGRQPIDTGRVEDLPDGGFGIGDGVVKAAYRWTFGDLQSGEEVDALYGLVMNRGRRRSVVVVEDPDNTPGLNERIHYGLFDSFEAYERRDVARTRWSLGVREWR